MSTTQVQNLERKNSMFCNIKKKKLDKYVIPDFKKSKLTYFVVIGK